MSAINVLVAIELLTCSFCKFHLRPLVPLLLLQFCFQLLPPLLPLSHYDRTGFCVLKWSSRAQFLLVRKAARVRWAQVEELLEEVHSGCAAAVKLGVFAVSPIHFGPKCRRRQNLGFTLSAQLSGLVARHLVPHGGQKRETRVEPFSTESLGNVEVHAA